MKTPLPLLAASLLLSAGGAFAQSTQPAPQTETPRNAPLAQPGPGDTSSPSGSSVEVLPEVDVVEQLNQERNSIVPNLGATSYDISKSQINVQSQGDDASFNQTILRAPGVVEDSFGQLHVRGEHANVQFRLNGILIPEGITGFGQELDSRFFDQVQLIDGALPAQFGFKTAGILDLQTKSGATDPGTTISMYGGSHDLLEPSLQTGGHDGKWNWYVEGSYLHTNLGIENPTSRMSAIHDESNQYRGFAYLSYVIDPTSRVTLFGGSSYSDFQIPDNPGQAPGFVDEGRADFNSGTLDENQHQQNSYAVLAYQKTFDAFSLQAALFERYSSVLFTPDRTGDLIFNGLAGRVDNSLNSQGIQFDSSYVLNEQHTLRAGFTARVAEQSASDPFSVFHADADGNQTSDIPFTIQQGDYRAGFEYGLYLQDEWQIAAPLTLNYGGRFDVVDEFTHQNQLSPRVNLTLQATSSTVAHIGYARYFTPPSFEAVSQRDVSSPNGTTNQFGTDRADPVRAERADYFDVGVTQDLGSGLRMGVDAYYKEAENQLDSGQFGAAVVETEFNYRHGEVCGLEFNTTYEHDGFSLYGNFAASRALGRDIDSQQFQFDPDELAYIRTHTIHLDHDQTYTASAGVAYKWKNTRVYADFLYGNGLRADFANQRKLPDYYPLNLGVEQKIPLKGYDLTLRFDIVNILDQVYELRDGSGVGVGAPQYGARRAIFGGMKFDF